ncbi:uncharacterized protein LOC134266116 [Saccostrea cucullata]|uniref:uncharacterized protein LOC134266116 n=1 Tax=Saccostrea cuccullata TaxID=36930 RepID=UPI002ED25BB5
MKGFSEKEDYYMDYGVEGDEDYEQLQVQSRETRNIEQMNVFGDAFQQKPPKRSLKRVLVVLVIITLLLGLVTTSVLLFLEKTKTDEKPLPTPLAINEFVSYPCKTQLSKSTDKGNADLGSRGRSFLVSFIQNHNDGNTTNRTIIVSSKTDFNITVALPESQSSNLISISSHRSNVASFKKLNVHYSLVPSYSAIESKGIIINTSVTSSVLSLTEYRLSSDTTTVFPMDKLSTNYIISTATPSNSYLGSGSHFTVASMKDNTHVSIEFVADHDTTILLQGRSYGRGDTFNIILNRYQTFKSDIMLI